MERGSVYQEGLKPEDAGALGGGRDRAGVEATKEAVAVARDKAVAPLTQGLRGEAEDDGEGSPGSREAAKGFGYGVKTAVEALVGCKSISEKKDALGLVEGCWMAGKEFRGDGALKWGKPELICAIKAEE